MSRPPDPPFVGKLWPAVKAALEIRDGMLADGASQAEADGAVEEALRKHWPNERVWHYLCDRCGDTGWRWEMCTATRSCGRPFRLPHARGEDRTGQGRCVPGHVYVKPCGCETGWKRRNSLNPQQKPVEDELAAIGRTSKPTRFGR